MAEMYDQITTHVEDAKNRQVWQYKEKDNFDKLIEIHSERMQILEDVLYDLLTKRAISTGEGYQLDRIGEYLIVGRNGLGDEPYRAQLFSAAGKLRKAGQVEVLISTLRALTGLPVSIIQSFPAHNLMHVYTSGYGALSNEDLIYSSMQSVKAAGVKLEIAEITTNNSSFIFSDNMNGGAVGQGFSTISDGSDGGSFAIIIG